MARVHGASDRESFSITDWRMIVIPARKDAEPPALDSPEWISAPVPGTAASALRDAGQFTFETCPAFDGHDVWYRGRLLAPARTNARTLLRLHGLSTLADVWLDGDPILSSSNMFHAHELDVTGHLSGEHTLLIRFRSLHGELGVRRPRPRWRTRLVENQQMRWLRTTLVGRIPAWSPPVAPVGPFRAVVLEQREKLLNIDADLRAGVDGSTGVLRAAIRFARVGSGGLTAATLHVGTHTVSLGVSGAGPEFLAEGALRIPEVALWWPHTHGTPALYAVRLTVTVDAEDVEVDLGRTGFRTLERTPGTGFGLRVNGVDIFCRGACWTPLDIVSLSASKEAYHEALTLARDGGMNMIRVGGTMVYEEDAFYEVCDELGILVFQDFMFANMDYPATDPEFVSSVTREAREFIRRVGLSPCIAVACGGSEVEQQAAMVGVARENWTSSLFQELLPGVVNERRPDVVYVPSTPTGGALPFHVDVGIAHYFGVGAYLRPFEDARRSKVRFSAECLAFANVPSDETIEELLGEGQTPPHHPRWKARVPRDSGPGWDFDDVRDHYVREIFSVDPVAVRYADVARYLALGRVATGEAMARTFGEWRRAESVCEGALVWFYRDLWAGAGWGVVDAAGRPKSAYFYLKRALAPVALFASDEGLNGVELSVVNDGASAIDGTLELTLLRDGATVVAKETASVHVDARGKTALRTDAILPHFFDTTQAYRFGPPSFHAMVAVLRRSGNGEELGTAFFFPGGLGREREDVGLEGGASAGPDGTVVVTLQSKKLAQAVAIDAPGFIPEDNYFHLPPGTPRTIALRPRRKSEAPLGSTPKFEGRAAALNGLSSARLKLI